MECLGDSVKEFLFAIRKKVAIMKKILQLFEQADLVRIVFGTSQNDEHDGELAFEYKEASLYSIKDKLEALGKEVEIIKF